ncbi:3491_t:CDS:2 [Dentiscutata erythropus]|uniref:3491_t:CDS:1 n=1 Tax=Dentiscutata erythropus TaxID=1348616 RepID=A0A9N9I0A0_9GLOM|nr:3491_t:CDS:2 [Dentiscutata erythropus]
MPINDADDLVQIQNKHNEVIEENLLHTVNFSESIKDLREIVPNGSELNEVDLLKNAAILLQYQHMSNMQLLKELKIRDAIIIEYTRNFEIQNSEIIRLRNFYNYLEAKLNNVKEFVSPSQTLVEEIPSQLNKQLDEVYALGFSRSALYWVLAVIEQNQISSLFVSEKGSANKRKYDVNVPRDVNTCIKDDCKGNES